jgi:hypothetical protein
LRQNSLDKTAEATGACQQRLEAAERGMGLSIPGRGVQAPTLGYKLDSFQIVSVVWRHVSSMVPSKDEHCMAQLKGAITSALQPMAQYKTLGMDTSAMSCRIAVLENKLNTL